MFCPTCGNQVAPDATLCPACGEDLVSPSYTKRGPSNWMIALAAITALASVSLAVWSSLESWMMTTDPRAQASIPRSIATASPSPIEGDSPTPTPSPSPIVSSEIEPGDYETYHNERFDYSISYPSNYLRMQRPPQANGAAMIFVSKDGRVEMLVSADHNQQDQSLQDLYNDELKPNREIISKVLDKKWFVISGYENGKAFYQKTILKDDIVKTVHIESDRALQPTLQPIIEKMVRSFK